MPGDCMVPVLCCCMAVDCMPMLCRMLPTEPLLIVAAVALCCGVELVLCEVAQLGGCLALGAACGDGCDAGVLLAHG